MKLNANGRIIADREACLVQSMRLSDDIHSCNTILDKGTKENCLILQITKPVAKGEQLVLWFSQEILAAMDIPFLNPINIKGTYKIKLLMQIIGTVHVNLKETLLTYT